MLKARGWVVIIGMASVCAVAEAAPFVPSNPDPIRSYSQQDLLKNWALSTCFAQTTHDEQTIKDAHAAAGGYLEFGHQGVAAYEALGELVKQFLGLTYVAKPEPGMEPPALNTMKCIDLFHSKELDRLTRRLVGSKPR